MQLETGKSSLGLVGSLRSIVAEEGYVQTSQSGRKIGCLTILKIAGSGDYIEVRWELLFGCPDLLIRVSTGLAPPLLLEAPKRAVKLCVHCDTDYWDIVIDCHHSAANDFWGKRFLSLAGTSTMTQSLSIATGCAAGATESFVVCRDRTAFLTNLIKLRVPIRWCHSNLSKSGSASPCGFFFDFC